MSAASSAIAPGVWGGDQVSLIVGADQAQLQLGCAQGRFPVPTKLDGQGRFRVTGEFETYAGGPTAGDQRPNTRTASFLGTVEGQRMTLIVRHAAGEERHLLTRGMYSKVVRCL